MPEAERRTAEVPSSPVPRNCVLRFTIQGAGCSANNRLRPDVEVVLRRRPDVEHPLVRRHLPTGRETLYLGDTLSLEPVGMGAEVRLSPRSQGHADRTCFSFGVRHPHAQD